MTIICAVLDRKSATAEELHQAAEEARRISQQNMLVQQLLSAALMPGADEVALRSALERSAAVLSFKPVKEAPLPKGFPPPTPVGEVRVNHYPSYRLARTQIGLSDGAAFFRLFRHIQAHEIAMTAPVEMTYASTSGEPQATEMAFLYRSPEQGRLGADGKVEVVDVPGQQAASIGWRGDANTANVAQARELLDGWLKLHAADYRASGQMRVMGYNSPFVAPNDRYFEVQMPVDSARPVSVK